MQISPKEFDLLCACAAVESTPERTSRIASMASSELDWNEFLRLAAHHNVLPLVSRSLKQHASGLPAAVVESLDDFNHEHVRRSLWFTSELARILDHFEKRNLKAVPYKGPLLAETVYGDPALRASSDLDFLVSPQDIERARDVLSELDYHPSSISRPAVERFWREKGYELAFDGKAGKYLVELQWALLPYFFAIDLRVDDLLECCGQTRLNGREVPCLSREDSLLTVCLHAAKHLWMRLIWVCDIAESLRTQKIDYTAVVDRARELGILRFLGVSFWLAAHLLEADLPPLARNIVTADSQIAALGPVFAQRLARGVSYDFESPEYFLLMRNLRERRADRYGYLWRLVWTPGVGDFSAVRLPELLFPLYHVVRLARLAGKIFRRYKATVIAE